jgi:hypothetical protein
MLADSIWKDLEVTTDEPVMREIGSLRIWFRKVYNEIWIASKESLNHHKIVDPIKELDWSRWVMKNENFKLRLMPVFPDNPIIVRPEYPFRVIRNAKARIYTIIPVWVRITSIDAPNDIITEIPTRTLSKTWFGDPTDGELCYWISTTARRTIDSEKIQDNLAICSLNIHNKSESDLQVEKICFRVERLTIFKTDTQLWADDTDISYRGSEQHSDITMTGKAPSEIKGAVKFGLPRNHIKKSIATRTFQRLKGIPLLWE